MRISGNDIVVDTYPAPPESPEAAGGALVPAGNRDAALSKSLYGTPDVHRQSSNTRVNTHSTPASRSRQDTVDIQELSQSRKGIRLYQQVPRALARAFDGDGPRHEYRLGSDGRLYTIGNGSTVDVNSSAGNSQRLVTGRELARWTGSSPADTAAQDYGVAAQAGYEMVRWRAQSVNQQGEKEQTPEGQGELIQQKGTYIDTWA